MLSLKNINVWFGHHHVLKNLSCTIEAGDFIVILGTNGAGKSTLFDTIAGRVQPTSGNLILQGQDITKKTEEERACDVTRIFQNTRLNSVGSFTVAQNLCMAHYSRRNARLTSGTGTLTQEQLEAIVHSIGMDTSILQRRMNQLSGGQRQLIAFAMSTQKIPKILLLDEPTAALDPQASTRLLQHATAFIKQHRVTTLLITHDPHIALSVGNKIWILENGQIRRTFSQQEKSDLHPNELIGQIDYASLS